MTIHYYGVVKIVSWTLGGLGALLLVVLDPTYKGFIIAGIVAAIPPTVTGVFNLVKLNEVHASSIRMESNVDGKLSTLIDTTKALSHAEGRREGVEATESKVEEQKELPK